MAGGVRLAAGSLLVALAILDGQSVRAFEFDEHCQISNDAFQLAVLRAEDSHPPLGEDILTRLRARFRGCRGSDTTSYGEWVALVDNALSPADLISGPKGTLSPAPFAEDRIHEEALRKLRRSWVTALFAAHLNDDHFQDRALYAFFTWHRQAVAMAADGKLWFGLLVNAFGDHFLEDQFAPGHVRTPRRELHDAAALAMHDYYNRVGALYHPHRTDVLADLVSPERMATLPDVFTGVDGPLAQYLAGKTSVVMKGDGRLNQSRDQRLVMTLTVARSIADVFDSYAQKRVVNSFPTFTWEGYRRLSRKQGFQLMSPRAATPFGEYTPEPTGALLGFNPTFGVTVGSEAFHGAPIESRWTLGGEAMLVGSPGRGWVDHAPTLPQFGLLGGYTFAKAGPLKVHSIGTRLVLPVTRLDLQVSALAKLDWYRQGPLRQRAFGFGGRFEMGFGMVFVGLGLERRHAFVDDHLHPHAAVTVSLTFVVPGRWLGF